MAPFLRITGAEEDLEGGLEDLDLEEEVLLLEGREVGLELVMALRLEAPLAETVLPRTGAMVVGECVCVGCGVVWFGAVWCGMGWYGIVLNGVV